jgi:NADH:ubiquinone oxidoreductase subunit 6 (subunit J)
MFVFILILLLLAAIFGVLGAVLKVAAIIVFSVVLAVAVLVAFAWWAIKRQAREFQRDAQRRSIPPSEPRFQANEADPEQLPDTDDRY